MKRTPQILLVLGIELTVAARLLTQSIGISDSLHGFIAGAGCGLILLSAVMTVFPNAFEKLKAMKSNLLGRL